MANEEVPEIVGTVEEEEAEVVIGENENEILETIALTGEDLEDLSDDEEADTIAFDKEDFEEIIEEEAEAETVAIEGEELEEFIEEEAETVSIESSDLEELIEEEAKVVSMDGDEFLSDVEDEQGKYEEREHHERIAAQGNDVEEEVYIETDEKEVDLPQQQEPVHEGAGMYAQHQAENEEENQSETMRFQESEMSEANVLNNNAVQESAPWENPFLEPSKSSEDTRSEKPDDLKRKIPKAKIKTRNHPRKKIKIRPRNSTEFESDISPEPGSNEVSNNSISPPPRENNDKSKKKKNKPRRKNRFWES